MNILKNAFADCRVHIHKQISTIVSHQVIKLSFTQVGPQQPCILSNSLQSSFGVGQKVIPSFSEVRVYRQQFGQQRVMLKR